MRSPIARFSCLPAILLAPTAAAQHCGPVEILASDGTDNDTFGDSVAVATNTVFVGATLADGLIDNNAGVVYVFGWDGDSWTQVDKLSPAAHQRFDDFGAALAVDGDTLLVGAPGRNNPFIYDVGSVYVYERIAGVWTLQTELYADTLIQNSGFGYAVALDGDTALIGAPGVPGDAQAGIGEGAVYVFTRTPTGWQQQGVLRVAAIDEAHYFGRAVALDANTALVGAVGAIVLGQQRGAAYVFTRSGSTWTQRKRFYDIGALSGDFFGGAVALESGVALIGASGDDGAAGVNQGSVYVYTGAGANWTLQDKIEESSPSGSNLFGGALAMHDGRAVVGAKGAEGSGGVSHGTAHLLRTELSGWVETDMFEPDDGAISDEFGFSVAILGDVAAVGARVADPNGQSAQGAAYIFRLTPCAADLNCDGATDGADLAAMLSTWGQPGASDLTGDGATDGADLASLLAAWGACN